jgi:itaconyl-CoA hydratase
VYSRSEVIEVRPSRSRPDVGLVSIATTGSNEDGTVVITFRRTLLVHGRGGAPRRPSVRDA